MRSDLTDITVVLDRSGSMQSIKDEAEGGLNAFIDEQKKAAGDANFTLVQFDSEYEFVHKGLPIKDVPRCTIQPRGMTALLDAVGRAINETGARLSAIPEDQRPGLVAFVILTDGMENASHEFKPAAIKEMIERQEKNYQWKFTYLGANQDAFAVADAMGIPMAAAGNYSPLNAKAAYLNAASVVSRARHSTSVGEQVDMSFTPEERASMS
jgi:hypothetical protein